MKTRMVRKEDVAHRWYLVDASGKTTGRLATRIARILMGKHKPDYTPHVDNGDGVVVINAAKIRTTPRKLEQQKYYRASGYPSGLKETPLKEVMAKNPARAIEAAVRRMMPKTNLGRKMMSKFKVYPDAEHPHVAQSPEPVSLDDRFAPVTPK